MCGIVGIVGRGARREEQRTIVRRMADSIVHRGPDDEGFYFGDSVALGMRRLSIIDLKSGQQPISNEDQTIWAVCNGEIYNYQAIRESLKRLGHRLRSRGDAEVIVHLYEQYGDKFVDYLDGMFGIALWDSRKKKLLLVRDRMGVKPVYYKFADGSLSFASELKAILAIPGQSTQIEKAALREYLTVGYCTAPLTIVSGIRKLEPGSMMVWQDGTCRQLRYWQVPDSVRSDLSVEEWVTSVQDCFREAVKSHMVSDVPIGAFLSGGVDSSAVVALMSEIGNQPVNTYSIGYGGDKTSAYFNELPHAAEIASRFNTNHHEIMVQPSVAELLPRLIWHLEEPISDSAIATTFLVSELAAKSVKVILSGVGGDELFAGYNRYTGDHYSNIYHRVPSWLRKTLIEPTASLLPSGRQSRWMDLARYARRFVEAGTLPWDEQYKYFVAIQGMQMLNQLLADESLQAPDGFDRILSEQHATDPLLRLMRVDCQTQLAEDLLLLTDKMTMAVSIECRVPFLDHRFVELAARIPTGIKRPGRELKYLLKKAMEPMLPDSILHRRKRGFGAPVGSWFKGELRPLRSMLLGKRVVESRGILSWPAIETVCREHDCSRHDYTDLILVLINLEVWCRLYVDGMSVEDVGAELSELGTSS